MTERRAAIVVTTIFEPRFLAGYLANIERFGRRETASIIVIPDRKTPPSVGAACAEATRRGFDVTCPRLDEQGAILQRLGLDPAWVPFDTDNRRNVGFLLAMEREVDVLVSIDDDNLCPDDRDFIGAHLVAGTAAEEVVVDSSDGWVNVCEGLEFADRATPFPRGFPYGARRPGREVRERPGQVRVAVNAGLWTEDPDVDAVTRLATAPRAVRWSGRSFVLGRSTWSPLNTQNTALEREAVAAYWYARMGRSLQGLKIDRYGDILSGYLLQACAKHLGKQVRFGEPVCRHERTPHDLFKDLSNELAGMVLVEELVPWLREAKLSGTTWPEAYEALADELEAAASKFLGFVWDEGGREFLVETARDMRVWLGATRRLL